VDHRISECAGDPESFRSHGFAHEMGVGAANAYGDRAQKVHVQAARRKLKNLLKGVFCERADQRRLNRSRSGGMRLARQEGGCSKETSLVNVIEDLVVDAVCGFRNFNAALAYQIKRISGFTFAENDLACFFFQHANFRRDALDNVGINAFEKPIIAKSLDRSAPCGRFHPIKINSRSMSRPADSYQFGRTSGCPERPG